ncbi:hypothetical protein BC938DRAFT_480553 [Jimgerdemannia flammicorona]|uniref:Uncharacterized protein n=1 Tax=Jimgerdemannia flammicorona TaxID=994334 RepID=A0A433QIA2_9FUNG|nr:hypothetical protein BC938DRAFT_480553 [Jimgerdemannia flammicorona]
MDEYFDRKSFYWNILDYLDESTQNTFDRKIEGTRPDRDLARKWATEHSDKNRSAKEIGSIHIHQPTFTGNSLGVAAISGGTVNVGSPINTRLSQKEVELASHMTSSVGHEELEDNKPEQSRSKRKAEEGLEDSDVQEPSENDPAPTTWEFAHDPPTWLPVIIEEYKKMTLLKDPNDRYESSLKPLWCRIVDVSSSIVAPSVLSNAEFTLARAWISSALQIGERNDWTVLQDPAERCLQSLAKVVILLKSLSSNQLKRIATTVRPEGIHGALVELRKYSEKAADSNLFLDNEVDFPSEDEKEIPVSLVEEDDYLDEDVTFILELLRYTHDMIAEGIPMRENSERDIDVFINVHIFSCLKGVVDRHFGEVVSRSSRDRRTTAVDASSDAEGYHLDWMFTRHDLGKDLMWGREFSLCERAGSKIENRQKVLNDSLKVQKTLKDMHRTLVDAVVAAGSGTISKQVFHVVPKLLMPGFISSRFFIRVILVAYVGAGFYLSTELAEFDIPSSANELLGVIKVARIMLQVKKLLRSTVRLFMHMKERAEREKFALGKVSVPDRQEEFTSPKKPRTKKSSVKEKM